MYSTWTACLWLLALPLLLFAEALQPGSVLAANDWLLTNAYFQHLAPAGSPGPANPNLYDQVFQFAPWQFIAWGAMREGEIPLWNPDSYCGTPLLATMGAAILYPIQWLLLPLPFEARFVASAVLRLWIAGLGTYCLTRRYGVSVGGSVVAGSSFMLCGYLIVWIGHPHTNVAVFLPWLVLVADRVLGATTRPQRWLATAGLALLVAIQFTGGHIESSADVLYTLALYCVARSWMAAQGAFHTRLLSALARTAMWPGIAVALGTLLAAPQLLPFLEWLPLSNEAHLRSEGSFAWWSWEFLQHLVSLPLVALPNLFGNPTWTEAWPTELVGGNYTERVLYVGIVPLVLALGAWIEMARRDGDRARMRWVAMWTAIGVIAMGRSFRMPAFLWLDQLPLLELHDPSRNRLIVAFTLCLTAAAGYERLREELAEGRRLALGRWLAIVFALGLAGAIAIRLGPIDRPEIYAPLVVLAALALVFSVASRFQHGVRRQRIISLSIAALTAADLLYFGRGFNTVTPSELFYPEHEGTAELQLDTTPHRTTALDWSLSPDAHLFRGLSDVRGMDYPLRWYSQYMDLTGDRVGNGLSYGATLSGIRSPLTRALNIKYLFASSRESILGTAGVRWRELDPKLWFGELEAVQPRSFMVFDSLRAPNDEIAQRILAADPARIYGRVILSDAPDAPSLASLADSGADLRSNAKALSVDYRREHSAWDVETQAPGYLVTTDSFYPGWNAYLDGVRVPLYRANLAFRSVHVPEGHHRVEYRYEPRSFRWGLWLGGAALGAVLSMIAAAMLIARRSARPIPETQMMGS